MKKIAYLLILCLLFGVMTTFVSCKENNENTADTSATAENSDSGNVGDSDSETGGDSSSESSGDTDSSSTPETGKSIDLYIIAGQSNATGHTKFDETVLASLWKDYKVGSENILYRGRAEYTNNVNTPQVSTGVNEVTMWTNAKAGQGKTTAHMGAEVGMASVLSSSYYTGDKVCGIVKYAHGGTSIFNSTSGENAANGNWVPPSYASAKGLKYEGLTGNLYRNLIDEVSYSIRILERNGYDDININGVFWMQGEADRGNPAEYKTALTCLINDIRNDLGELVGEDLSDLAFMIGEISRTSGSAKAETVATNEAFISMQRDVANTMDNVYAIASSAFEINWLEGGEDKNGQDKWHWTTEHMFCIGELVAECILDNILKVK